MVSLGRGNWCKMFQMHLVLSKKLFEYCNISQFMRHRIFLQLVLTEFVSSGSFLHELETTYKYYLFQQQAFY